MRRLLFVLIFLATTALVLAQEPFTIYLVRHAEKVVSETNPGDPELTQCGEARAESLANFLSEEPLEAIYSTEYIRTVATATPTAGSQGLRIQYYDPTDLDDFAARLLQQGENALVVGHSDTTEVLAGILSGSEYKARPIDSSEYDRIYQVVISTDSIEVHLFRSAFVCQD